MVSNSTQDQTAGYLASKVQAGANIQLTTLNALPGGSGDEKLEIAVTGIATDTDQVRADAGDTTPGFLDAKLTGSGAVTLSVVGSPGDSHVDISVPAPIPDDHLVLASGTDSTPGSLLSKLQAGANITLNLVAGVDEKVEIVAAGGGGGPVVTDISALCTFSGWDTSAGTFIVLQTKDGERVTLDICILGVNNNNLCDIVVPHAIKSGLNPNFIFSDTSFVVMNYGLGTPTQLGIFRLSNSAPSAIQMVQDLNNINWPTDGFYKYVYGTFSYLTD